MAKFEIKAIVRRNNKNLRVTESLLKILKHAICDEYFIAVEFDKTGKARFTKRRFINNTWESVDL